MTKRSIVEFTDSERWRGNADVEEKGRRMCAGRDGDGEMTTDGGKCGIGVENIPRSQ